MGNHIIKQKSIEIQAIQPILPIIAQELGIDHINERMTITETPDFIFSNGNKSIGVEVIECHPSTAKHKKDNAPSLKSYKERVCRKFSENLYLKSITEGYYNKLNIIIYPGSLLSTIINVDSICATIEYYLKAYHEGTMVRNNRLIKEVKVTKTIGRNIIQFNNIGRIDPIQSCFIRKCIEKKDLLYDLYNRNNPCSEYWLCIHLPWEEYKNPNEIVFTEPRHRLSKVLKKSKFTRICLTSCLYNGLSWLKGNPQKIKRRKRIKAINIGKKVPKAINLSKFIKMRTLLSR